MYRNLILLAAILPFIPLLAICTHNVKNSSGGLVGILAGEISGIKVSFRFMADGTIMNQTFSHNDVLVHGCYGAYLVTENEIIVTQTHVFRRGKDTEWVEMPDKYTYKFTLEGGRLNISMPKVDIILSLYRQSI